jgi:hypothetical protein
MAKKLVDNTPHNCYVAFLDIMGFKDRLLKDGHEKVGELLNMFHDKELSFIKKLTEGIYLKEQTKTRNNRFKIKVGLVSFSDSIILFSHDDRYTSARDVFLATKLIIYQALRNGIPINGAIAHGLMTVDNTRSLYFGQPLIDAVELQKELLLYSVVLHHTVEKHLRETSISSDLDLALNSDSFSYPVPLKCGITKHNLLDMFLGIRKDDSFIGSVAELYNDVSGKSRQYIDNTIDFLYWLKSERSKTKESNKKTI